MKIFKLFFTIILVVKAIKMQTLDKTPDDNNGDSNMAAEEVEIKDQSTSLGDYDEDGSDDVVGRHLQQIQLYTNDERCNDIAVCSGMEYGDKAVVVTFSHKTKIRFTSKTTYEIKEPTQFYALTFVNSKFANFPLQLFYAFKVQQLDFRNCSVETLKWDNFLGADKLSILLLSENRLKEIKPSLFALAENLSFLFLDSNRISVLHNDSFKGLEKLNYLDLHNNLIESLPSAIFSHLPLVQQINLAENRLHIIEQALFANNRRLYGIHLQQNALNEIQEYAFTNQDHLVYLDISHNADLETLVFDNFRVENLWAKNCSLNRVDIYGQAVNVDLQQNSLKELYFSQPEYVETLLLKDNALEQISSLDLNTNLRVLDVSNNPDLNALPKVRQIDSLERLDLSNTSLKEIPINILISSNKLTYLNVSHNQIEEINPLNFKYIKKLSHFYIQNNNWNCYNLQMLMDVVIKPLKISYTFDLFDNEFPGEYIQGVKCMYRVEQTNDDYYMDTSNFQHSDTSISSSPKQEYNQLKSDNSNEVEKLRHEFKAIVGIYEQKFSLVMNKINDLDLRLREFERFNKTMWQQVSIVV